MSIFKRKFQKYTYEIKRVRWSNNDRKIAGVFGAKENFEGYDFDKKMDMLQNEGWEVCGPIQPSPPGTWVGEGFCYVPMRKLKK